MKEIRMNRNRLNAFKKIINNALLRETHRLKKSDFNSLNGKICAFYKISGIEYSRKIINAYFDYLDTGV